MKTCALIMAGGHGTRFWPWSSPLLPKQFLPIASSDRSLLQETFDRIVPLTTAERILVLTNEEFVAIVREQLPQIPAKNIIGEPLLRDTAAAVALGSLLAAKRWPDAIQLVLPSDHYVRLPERFRELLAFAAKSASKDGKLYTVGIKATRATSAYGYLKRGAPLSAPEGIQRASVEQFVEKPDIETAREYVSSGLYDWNAGMFAWTPEAFTESLALHLPQHALHLPLVLDHEGAPDFPRRLKDTFLKLPKISIDYGLMQAEGSSGNVRCIQGDFGWSDLGGWEAFAENTPGDAHSNHIYGEAWNWQDDKWNVRFHPREPRDGDKDEMLSLGRVYTLESENNVVFNNRRGHSVALFGVKDLAVVHTHRATLIAPRCRVDDLKALVSNLPEDIPRGGFVKPRKVIKPWGWELWWAWTDDFAGKTLFLQEGKRFSLQYHVVKEEVIYLHQGAVVLETAPRGAELQTVTMKPGDAIHVEPGRMHRITASEDSLLFEASLPFLWDVVRVADDFGREGTREA